MDPRPGEPVVPFASTDEFERWLAANPSATIVWIRYAKKGTGVPSIDWNQAVDVALCFGWIDGQSKSIDDTAYVQRFTPRGPRSKWSKVNRDRVERLTAAGKMRPQGLAEVERAKADGRWDAAYDSPKTATVPDDLAAALAANPAAKAAFDTIDGSNRYGILYRIQDAKQPATRARRIEQLVAMLARGETLHPRPSAKKGSS
jgi:uncharacterized protein YdeI (YjbR/CyaY-like superfamily)